jgi:hypothetical protein
MRILCTKAETVGSGAVGETESEAREGAEDGAEEETVGKWEAKTVLRFVGGEFFGRELDLLVYFDGFIVCSWRRSWSGDNRCHCGCRREEMLYTNILLHSRRFLINGLATSKMISSSQTWW